MTCPASAAESDGRHDFDFIFGRWTIHNHKLRSPAELDCTDWIEFETTSRVVPILGGLSHAEHIRSGADSADGEWEGFTLRQFDPRDRLWRIWWASTRNPGHLDPPLTGRFEDGIGRFGGTDTIAGRPIKVRFHWSNPSPAQARWSQAFSRDDGRTFQENWIMDFRRPSFLGGTVERNVAFRQLAQEIR